MGEKIRYKFREDELIDEIKRYIDKTYEQHYSSEEDPNVVQPLELWAKHPLRGVFGGLKDVVKYADRYGTKEGFNRSDILKAIHYGLFALYCHDRLMEQNENVREKTLNEIVKQDH